MKVYFGFNAIGPDGMGSAAMTLLHALKRSGVNVQTVHPWKEILIPEFYQFNPIFLSESNEEKPLSDTAHQMISIINSDPECAIFSHFGSPNWGAIVPYLRPDIRIVVSVHSVTPSALKIALANQERTSKFIAVSWEVEKILKQKLSPKDHWKISLVPNAIDINLHSKKIEFSKVGEKIKILFFGRIEDYTKGVDKIPKIAKKLKNAGLEFEWDLYGYFHWGYESRFYKQVKANEVEDVINYKGCLTPTEIPSILNKYDVMVMPSNHEGLPIALMESMGSGLTSIASRLQNVTDKMVENGKEGFLISKNDINGFADAILKVSADPILREQIGTAARNKVTTHFSIDQHGVNYCKVFEDAMADKTYICTPTNPLSPGELLLLPEALKPHILARILPPWMKRILKKII